MPNRRMRKRPRTSSTMSTVSPSTTFKTVAVVAAGSACATELAMTEHAGATAAVTTAATNRVRVRMLGICRQGLTCMTASRAGKRALLKSAIRRPNQQPAASRSDNSRRT